jgi:molybdopterin converting factor small subunit
LATTHPRDFGNLLPRNAFRNAFLNDLRTLVGYTVIKEKVGKLKSNEEVSKMEIRYLGSVQATTGERKLSWEKPEATLRELLRDLALHYGPRFKYWVLDRGNVPDKHIIVRINGRDVRYLDNGNTPLHPNDTISVASTMRLRPAL